MELELEAIVATFMDESDEGLASAEDALVTLERAPEDVEAIGTLFRVVHTIKGNAGTFGFGALEKLAHSVEDVLARLRKGELHATAELVTALLRSVDALRAALHAASDGPQGFSPSEQRALEVLRGAAAASLSAGRGGANGAGDGSSHHDAPALERTLRVDMATLDGLVNLSGELTIVHGRLNQTLAALNGSGAAAREVLAEAQRIFADLQESVMRARMVPLGPVFRRFGRIVRDLAVARGKAARLITEGDEVEVDTSIVEGVRDPLTHMVRNAVDHGLETPEARRLLGKDPCGTITLRARRQAGSMVIEVRDDGRGLDRQAIRVRGRALGMVAEGASDAELARLIFEPGFSTAESVTEISGRGVGLDVVRRNVEALRGSVAVSSQPGQGTTMALNLPLTLAIITGLNVDVCGATFVIPLDTVVECVELPGDCFAADAHGVLSLRGGALPYVRLQSLFGPTAPGARRGEVVVVRSAAGTAGLAVDRVLGEGQTVVKPLGRVFRGLPGISGATILGSGEVALIVDVASLIREELARAATAKRGARAGEGPGEGNDDRGYADR